MWTTGIEKWFSLHMYNFGVFWAEELQVERLLVMCCQRMSCSNATVKQFTEWAPDFVILNWNIGFHNHVFLRMVIVYRTLYLCEDATHVMLPNPFFCCLSKVLLFINYKLSLIGIIRTSSCDTLIWVSEKVILLLLLVSSSSIPIWWLYNCQLITCFLPWWLPMGFLSQLGVFYVL